MPNVSPTFILKTKNALNVIIQGFTRGIKYTGNVILRNSPGNEVEVDIEQPGSEVSLFEDWLGANIQGLYNWYNIGTTGFVLDTNFVDEQHWGVAVANMPSNSWGFLAMGDAAWSPMILGSAKLSFETLVKFDILSTGTKPYYALMGLGTDMSGAAQDFPSGVFFVYNNAANGDFWQVKGDDGGGPEDIVTTVPIIAGEWYKLRVDIVPTDGMSDPTATFYINDVNVGQVIKMPLAPVFTKPAFYFSADVSADPDCNWVIDYFRLNATMLR